MKDVITREIVVRATQERVYRAITEPAQIVTWFPDAIEGGTLEVGERPIFIFGSENHRSQIYVEASTPYSYFAYRWVPGSGGIVGDVLAVPNTLVEFIIESLVDSTKVTVRESGFASLPVEVAQASFEDNTGGWEYMFGRLEQKMNLD